MFVTLALCYGDVPELKPKATESSFMHRGWVKSPSVTVATFEGLFGKNPLLGVLCKCTPPPPCPAPPQGTRFPPTPGGTVTKRRFPPWGGGGVHHSRPANSSITQLKIFFGAFGACDFLLISYCSWAK